VRNDEPEFARPVLEALAPGLAVVVGRGVVERDDLAALRQQLGHVVPGLLAALQVVGDDQADVLAGPDADIGDDHRDVLRIVDGLDRLGDHDAVAREDQHPVHALRRQVLKVGDLLRLVVVAAVGDQQVDVDALRLPLGRRLAGTVHHRHEERIGTPEHRVADLEVLGLGRRRRHQGHGGSHRRDPLPLTHIEPPSRLL
jgi:hypothetical protein